MLDGLWTHARIASMESDTAQDGTEARSYGLIEDGAIGFSRGRIAWIGPHAALPAETRAQQTYDAHGRCITPGLIDAHTHLIYGGNRAHEFEMRLSGASYEDIAQGGGGILSTVLATRTAGCDALTAAAAARLARMCSEGVTTVEIKSGYGLDLETELHMLRIARRLGERLPVTVCTTFLGAHTVPPEFKESPDEYIRFVCEDVMPAAAREGLVDAVDAFCERIAFTPEQVARVFDAAKRLGLPVKLHADQLSDYGGAALAAHYGALSADHLEHTSVSGIDALARAGTVAVLLPGAYYFLREANAPPVAELRAGGVPIAIATDCNPGTSPLVSLLLAVNMACTLFRLTPAEALAGVTRNAARALGLSHEIGTLAVRKRADFIVWDVAHPVELAYAIGANPAHAIYKDGRPV
ncbi:MAG: imidazolonepropionase [Candidatus Eremiobacteraeota bacterium]|nr:imidazolonepropionase [Candidatus Eremiobacteraeota bacterium]